MIKDKVVKAALAARTRAHVAALEELLRLNMDGAHYRYVDDNPGNWSSVTSAADPRALLFERVTNMFDALIEARAEGRRRKAWANPFEAVKDLFDLPDGVDALNVPRRIALAKDARMTVYDSDDSVHKPTIAFHDRGIGLTGAQMPKSILSLNRSPKLGTVWAHGVFGKGGTTASQYSDYTIIVTRRQPELLKAGEQDMVSVAIMGTGNDPDIRMPFFQYLVDGKKRVYSVPASEAADFEPGTYIAHINYELGQAGASTWEREQSVYSYAESVLFRPVLPYSLHDARTGSANQRPEGRQEASALAGLGRRLDQATGKRRTEKILDHSDWASIEVADVGEVRLRWWLFENEDARRRRAAKRYSVLFTSNGQTHNAWDQQRLQSLIQDRRRVGARLLVEVDCDRIPIMTRVQLFTSDRNAMRSSVQVKALEDQVVEALSGDPTLTDHEREFVNNALKASKGVTEAFLDRLNRAIKIKTAGLRSERSTDQHQPPSPPPPLEDLYPEPTYLEGPETVKALLGKSARIYLRTNAIDGFVPERGRLTVTAEADAPVMAPNVGDLRAGRLRVSLQVPPDAEPATYKVNFALAWEDAEGQTVALQWDTKVEVVSQLAPKPGKSPKKKPADAGDVAFLWSRTAEQPENHWTNQTAGDLQYLQGSALADRDPKLYGGLRKMQRVPTVLLNEDFTEWATYRKRIVNKRGDRTDDLRTTKYGVAVGSAVALIYGRENDYKAKQLAGKTAPDPMDEAQQQRAVTAAALTALVLLPDLDVVTSGGADPDD